MDIQQSQKEFEHMARLQQERAQSNQIAAVKAPETTENANQNPDISILKKKVKFPFGMAVLAIFFDLIGLIPFVNFISEPIAGLIFGFWQKSYVPHTDPFMTFLIAKMTDLISFGFLPSNTSVVVFAYSKKKARNMV